MRKRFKPHIRTHVGIAITLCLWAFFTLHCSAQSIDKPVRNRAGGRVAAVSTPADSVAASVSTVKTDSTLKLRTPVLNEQGDTVKFTSGAADSLILAQATFAADTAAATNLGKLRVFNPDPKRAMWLSALCPGLGQIYNRRYWKLPIVVGAFVGLGYGTAWNNRMLSDYTKAYRDITDNDPNTRSYMNFFPKTMKESDIDMEWLTRSLKNKRTYYRRYRDICIISMVAVYLINIVDAYVDASLAHFDISSDLSMEVAPAAIDTRQGRIPSLGLQCAINF